MILRRDPETQRLRVELEHAEEWRRHMRSFPKPTLRETNHHLFREAR